MTVEELEQKYLQIPQEIKNTRRWVCYRTELRENGEVNKIPTNAITGGYASTSDPRTWTTFKLAMSGCVKFGFAGIGFMLGEDASGITYSGVDLDNHIDKVTGKKPYETQEEFEAFANIFINQLNSYTEYSHSGEGIHIIFKGKLPGKRNKKNGVEMYDYRRFFTMTGKVINNVPIAERSEEIKPLWEKYLNTEEEQAKVNNAYVNRTTLQAVHNGNGAVSFEEVAISKITPSSSFTDYELVEKIRNSQQGQTFMKLFNGDMSEYGNDHSLADMALCKILAFWTGCNPAQMDRIFRSSALIRDKWDRRWGDGTYGSHTIDNAIQTQSEIYNPKRKEEVIIVQEKTVNNTPIQPQGDIVEFTDKGDPIVTIKQIFKTYPLTDTGNAERFYDYFGDYFRYDTKLKSFLFWNGKTWIPDNKIYIKKYANLLLEVLKKEIKDTEQKIQDALSMEQEINITEEVSTNKKSNKNWTVQQYEELLKAQRDNLKRVSNKAGKEAMIEEFKGLHEIPVTTEEFDTQPYLLNTDSGVVDLTTSKILPFDRKYKLSKNTNTLVSYEEPKTWLKFLHDILARPKPEETEELVNTVQLLLGDALTGRENKDLLVIMYGNGSNGKSTFINVVNDVLGDYAQQINPEIIMQQKNGSAQATEFAFAAIKGARLLSMSETDEGEKMSDKTIKKLTSGEKIAAQFKFGMTFNYKPTFSPFMSTNNLPIIRSKDFGIWRRIFLIPFLVKFTDETKDIEMPNKLKKELPQILGWAIKGYLKLRNDHKGIVPKPKCVEESLSEYKGEMDVVNFFINANAQNFPGYKTSSDAVYRSYKMWANDNNEYSMPESKFKKDMAAHGFELKRDATYGWVYVGIKLNSDTKGHDFALEIESED